MGVVVLIAKQPTLPVKYISDSGRNVAKLPNENESSLDFGSMLETLFFYILITEMLHISSFEKGRAPDDNSRMNCSFSPHMFLISLWELRPVQPRNPQVIETSFRDILTLLFPLFLLFLRIWNMDRAGKIKLCLSHNDSAFDSQMELSNKPPV